MKAIFVTIALAVGIKALLARDASCYFHLTSNGRLGGPVGQLSDGQNRLGQSGLPVPEGQYCLSNGRLTDGKGRGCILTPPTTQFQCDTGATPSPGFTLGTNGTLALNGTSGFYACPTGDNGGYNIYVQPLQGEPRCVPIGLQSDACAPPPPATTSASPPAPKATCPGELTGHWEASTLDTGFAIVAITDGVQYPHLMVPIDSATPNKAYGTSYNGTVSNTLSTIFNFDIPASDATRVCTLQFFFPTQSTLVTSSYAFTSNANSTVGFAMLNAEATKDTTFATQPTVWRDLGIYDNVAPGNAYVVTRWPCPGGKTIGVRMSGQGLYLNYFQDYNRCPIGLYVTVD